MKKQNIKTAAKFFLAFMVVAAINGIVQQTMK